jgi:tol-pal system protein YbgF
VSATLHKELRQLRQQAAESEDARREQAKRIDELESRMAALVGEIEQRKGEAAHRESVPPLPVVTLRPGKESAEATAPAPAPAPAAPAPAQAALPNLGVVKRPEAEAARAGGKGAASARELYRRGRGQIGAGQKREAMDTLGELVERFPQNPLADDAQLLLGELHFMRHGYAEAAAAFREVLHRWPHGDKAPEAQLKLADCQFAQGRQAAGREALRAVIAHYPRSPVARQARRRLAQQGRPR